MTHPAQQKVINSVLNALKADNNTVKVGAFAESDIKHIPQAFGDNQKSQYQGSLEFNAGGENWDAKIHDIHHQHKKDAPSGTAKAMLQYLEQASPQQKVQVTSERTGDVVGEHYVTFSGPGEER